MAGAGESPPVAAGRAAWHSRKHGSPWHLRHHRVSDTRTRSGTHRYTLRDTRSRSI